MGSLEEYLMGSFKVTSLRVLAPDEVDVVTAFSEV